MWETLCITLALESEMILMYTRYLRKKSPWNPSNNLVDRHVDKMWITFEILFLTST